MEFEKQILHATFLLFPSQTADRSRGLEQTSVPPVGPERSQSALFATICCLQCCERWCRTVGWVSPSRCFTSAFLKGVFLFQRSSRPDVTISPAFVLHLPIVRTQFLPNRSTDECRRGGELYVAGNGQPKFCTATAATRSENSTPTSRVQQPPFLPRRPRLEAAVAGVSRGKLEPAQRCYGAW